MNTHACISIYACVCMHTKTHTHTHFHTLTHTHAHRRKLGEIIGGGAQYLHNLELK